MTPIDACIKGWVNAILVNLEMRSPPDRAPARPPRSGIEVRRAVRPTASFYRYLFETIGKEWTWTGRRLMDEAALYAVIHDPLIEVNVLWVDGVPAGLAELDRRLSPEIELCYFGLIPDFIGKGLGGFFLDWAVDRAWSTRPSRFWVHTCDLDHPNALPVYKKAGFIAYQHEQVREVVLHDMPAPKRAGKTIEVEESA